MNSRRFFKACLYLEGRVASDLPRPVVAGQVAADQVDLVDVDQALGEQRRHQVERLPPQEHVAGGAAGRHLTQLATRLHLSRAPNINTVNLTQPNLT